MDGFLHSLVFSKSTVDSNLYFKVVHNHVLILVLYVDDLFLTSDEQLINGCKRELTSEFKMKDLELMHYFLGLAKTRWDLPDTRKVCSGYLAEIWDARHQVHERTYDYQLDKVGDSASSSQSVDSTLYRQLIGSLMYLVHTRPDIGYTVNAPSEFMSDPKHIHLVAAKHVLRYMWGTITYGLRYTSSNGVLLSGYSNSYWAGNAVNRKKYLWLLPQYGISNDLLV